MEEKQALPRSWIENKMDVSWIGYVGLGRLS